MNPELDSGELTERGEYLLQDLGVGCECCAGTWKILVSGSFISPLNLFCVTAMARTRVAAVYRKSHPEYPWAFFGLHSHHVVHLNPAVAPATEAVGSSVPRLQHAALDLWRASFCAPSGCLSLTSSGRWERSGRIFLPYK